MFINPTKRISQIIYIFNIWTQSSVKVPSPGYDHTKMSAWFTHLWHEVCTRECYNGKD